MIDQSNLEMFNSIYETTYQEVLGYIISKCENIQDANDILQETYLEFYKILCKKKFEETNPIGFIKRIAFYKIKKHYSLWYKIVHHVIHDEDNYIENIQDDYDLENVFKTKEEARIAFDYVMSKGGIIPKVFYFYYYEERTIKEISLLLGKNESYIKNVLYRTLKELKQKLEVIKHE